MKKNKSLEKFCREIANQKYIEIRKFSNCNIICIDDQIREFNSWEKVLEYLVNTKITIGE